MEEGVRSEILYRMEFWAGITIVESQSMEERIASWSCTISVVVLGDDECELGIDDVRSIQRVTSRRRRRCW